MARLGLTRRLLSLNSPSCKYFHTTAPVQEIRKEAKLRCVDNSKIGMEAMKEGKPPRCIHIYSYNQFGYIGKFIIIFIWIKC